MKIVIDFCHPAHVHYFRNFIVIMQSKGHEFLFFARDRYPIQELLNHYKLPFINRGKGSNSMLGKLLYIPKAVFTIYKHASKFKPDLFIDYGDFYAAFNAFFLRAYYIALDDTETAWMGRFLHMPFTHAILTPASFKKDLGRKHLRYPGIIELAYLHPNRYIPNSDILNILGVKDGEKYAILRFVSWNAHHDVGHHGISYDNKKKLIRILSQYLKVFISSENELPPELKPHQIKIDPERMHDAMYYAHMLVGESGTMANESAILGTPSIIINPLALHIGVHSELSATYHLQYLFANIEDAWVTIERIANDLSIKKKLTNHHRKLLENIIDVTSFLVWFVESFPQSSVIMKNQTSVLSTFR